MPRGVIALAVLVGLISGGAVGYEADLSYVEGIIELTGACFIQGVKLESDPPELVAWPEAQGEALYGEFRLAEGGHAVMIDRLNDRILLYVDPNGSAESVLFEWDRVLADGSLLASVPLELSFSDGASAPYRLFVMWRGLTPTVLAYCRDTYREGVIGLKDRPYKLAVIDEDTDGQYDALDGGVLLIDADGDSRLLASSDSHERFRLNEPFNLAGTVYRVRAVAADGSSIQVDISDEDVPPKPALLVGFPAPLFELTDVGGENIAIETLRGQIVVLDFWAGWCGPCIAELPTLETIHQRFADEGVSVLGINLDRSVEEFEEALTQHGIVYRQVYDGPDGPINTLYRIEGIPMTYVIDPDGVIRGRGLRGAQLLEQVESLLAEKKDGAGDPNDP